MLRTIVIFGLLCLSTLARAGDATGFVNQISVGNDSSIALFDLTGDNEDIPRCNETKKYSLLLNTVGGRAAFEALLDAKRNKYVVRVEGTNGCKFYWKAEDLLNLTIQ